MPEFEVAPSRMVLLTIDLQNVFVDMAKNGLEVVARINRIAEVCRAAGIPVIHVRHALAQGADAGLLGELSEAVRDGMLDRSSHTAALHPTLVVEASDELLEKPHFGAFYDTDLLDRLARLGADTIVIAGIETNVCCETTAREAMVRDVRAFFVSDATTTGGVPGLSVEEVQRASLATVGTFFAQLTTTDELIEQITAAANA